MADFYGPVEGGGYQCQGCLGLFPESHWSKSHTHNVGEQESVPRFWTCSLECKQALAARDQQALLNEAQARCVSTPVPRI